MAGKEECQSTAKQPRRTRGETSEEGCYYRAVKSAHLARHYEDDGSSPYVAGKKLRNQLFKELLKQSGFSVNCCECQPDPGCTLIWIDNRDFTCVLKLDIRKLSEMTRLTVVATYDPLPMNTCHYNLSSLEESDDAFKLLLRDRYNALVDRLPKSKNIPRSDSEKMSLISQVREDIQSVFAVVLLEDDAL